MTEFTNDSLFGGGLQIRQAKSGYRFSMDALVLAGLAPVTAGDRILDLGTGCGVIALMLAYLHPDITVYGVEIQKTQADIAARNVTDNRLENRIIILQQDINQLTPSFTSGVFDMVVCNPPHIEKSRGRINPDKRLALARHEIKITLGDLVKTSGRMLAPMGRLVTIYPPDRLAELMEQMRSNGIEPKKMHPIYTKPDTDAKRIVVEGVKHGRPGLKISKPFIIHHSDGTYTRDAQAIFE